ncbi:MAG TPA: substrate-binding domain-containing protein [Actinomycetota bacterium]|nr:substrate-binding domain-containing protein [Actinomycetota bacterium]
MRKGTKGLAVVAAALSLSLLAAACGGDDGGNGGATGSGDLSGTIVISGSSTVLPISSLVAELFNEEVAPNVAITVDGPGTGDGFELFCAGETDISDASRPIEQEEIDACAENGIEYIELEVAIDGIAVMTNPANDAVTCLNQADLYALFGPESEGFGNWTDANALAAEVGGTGNFPDAPLEITAPGEESGTYDSFIEINGFEDVALERGVAEDQAAALRKDYQPSPDDNVIIAAMEGADAPLGFVGFAYAEEAGDAVKEIEIDGGSGCVAPTTETIAAGSYPISRSLYIYVNAARAAENPALTEFVDYYLTDTGLVDIVSEVGYVGLPAERVEATRSAWASA